MKDLIKQLFVVSIFLFLGMQLTSVAALADVEVFAEGAFTDTELELFIYVDTTVNTSTELRSAGIKLTYDPIELTLISSEKNEADWYIGNEPYMDPDTSHEGEVIFMVGKIDTEDISAGVSGNRVLIGKVKFSHSGLSSVSLGLDYGKRGTEIEPGIFSFKNFVDMSSPSNVLDDIAVIFGEITLKERGDANADDDINILDIRFLREKIGTTNNPPWVDCDGNGIIDILDVRCVRQKI